MVGSFDEAVDAISGTNYDIVLTDMCIPTGRGDMLRDKSLAKVPQELGIYVLMLAVAREIPYAAMCTDANHHESAQVYAMVDVVFKRNLEFIKMGQTGLFKEFKWAYKTPDGDIGSLKEGEAKGFKYEDLIAVKDWAHVVNTILKHDSLKEIREIGYKYK